MAPNTNTNLTKTPIKGRKRNISNPSPRGGPSKLGRSDLNANEEKHTVGAPEPTDDEQRPIRAPRPTASSGRPSTARPWKDVYMTDPYIVFIKSRPASRQNGRRLPWYEKKHYFSTQALANAFLGQYAHENFGSLAIIRYDNLGHAACEVETMISTSDGREWTQVIIKVYPRPGTLLIDPSDHLVKVRSSPDLPSTEPTVEESEYETLTSEEDQSELTSEHETEYGKEQDSDEQTVRESDEESNAESSGYSANQPHESSSRDLDDGE